jgi:hypothetical protein
MGTGLGRGHLLRSVIVFLSVATALPLVGSDRQAGATTSPTQETQMLLLTRADVPGNWVVDGGPSAVAFFGSAGGFNPGTSARTFESCMGIQPVQDWTERSVGPTPEAQANSQMFSTHAHPSLKYPYIENTAALFGSWVAVSKMMSLVRNPKYGACNAASINPLLGVASSTPLLIPSAKGVTGAGWSQSLVQSGVESIYSSTVYLSDRTRFVALFEVGPRPLSSRVMAAAVTRVDGRLLHPGS